MSFDVRHRLAVTLAAATLTASGALVATAPPVTAGHGGCHAFANCGGSETIPGTPGSPGSPGGGGGGGGGPVAARWIVRLGPANELSQIRMQEIYGQTWPECWVAEPSANGGYTYQQALEEIEALFVSGGLPPCPFLGDLDPTAAIEIVWEELIDVPVPGPRIDPGKAITGLPAYLETGMENPTFTQVVENPFGGPGITIEGTATFVIDWGDGSPEESTTKVGAPYAERDGGQTITHVYPRSGEMTVEVDAHWRGTWQVGESEPVAFETVRIASGPPVLLPVEQVQAVRNR